MPRAVNLLPPTPEQRIHPTGPPPHRTNFPKGAESRLEQRQHQQLLQLQQSLSFSESSERNGGIAGPCNQCTVQFEFQCAAGGDAAIVGLGIGHRVNFGYIFASREYRYNHDHGVHGKDTVTVLLNGSNTALVRVNKDDVDNGGDGVTEGGVAAVVTVSVDMINSDTNLKYYNGHAHDGSRLAVSTKGFTIELGPYHVSKRGAGGQRQ